MTVKFYRAGVANIIQGDQRDESFIEELQQYLISAVKCFGQRNYNRVKQYVPLAATTWYYSLTSLSNLLTLGEEYAGTIRLGQNNKIPPTCVIYYYMYYVIVVILYLL